jgi:DNA-binding XRE family transcriptional regulator
MSTVKVANADRMIVAVVLSDKGIDTTFADGSKGTVPFKDIPEVGNHSNLKSVELPNPYEVILTTPQNEQVELPWDFVRHYCDRTYRPKMELIAAEGRQVLGTRVRAFREDAGLTQEALAQAAGIGRVTLVRLENGKHVPKLGTLRAIAKILERPVEDLLTGHEEPRHTE